MTKREFFDLIVVVPLEEEVRALMEVFPGLDNRCTPTDFRYVLDTGTVKATALVVQQHDMGKSNAAAAVATSLLDFDAGLIVCLGIAASLSKDIHLCDVCYSGTIIDVYDNTKALDGSAGDVRVEFSPTQYSTPREITTAFNFIRTVPHLRKEYETWQATQEAFGKSLVTGPLVGRDGREEIIGRPLTKNGTIACGAVSTSEVYNKRLLAIDRKMLAIETESGGVFEQAKGKVDALTIRGISDYADSRKQALEDSTSGLVRRLAVNNAASFLKLQLANPFFLQALEERREAKQGRMPLLERLASPRTDLIGVIAQLGRDVDTKLRELSPEFRLQPQGYRLPLPRIRRLKFNAGLGDPLESDPTEVSIALENANALLISIPRTYPDYSLPWLLANDLLTQELSGKQVIPLVIEGDKLKPPHSGFVAQSPPNFADVNADGLVVFIVDSIPVQSRTRLQFIVEQTKTRPDAKFIFLTRTELNLINESEFASKVGADLYALCDISFVEIAHFIQKNFSMTGSEAEVIALRLRDTFDQFDLSAHPTYFAGIPRETLSALLQANRRAELIQLAVDGFLTFLVAQDTSDVSLSRTTRSRFLRHLSLALKVEKRAFTQEDLVRFTREFSAKYDFDIDPLAFIHSFAEKGILHFEDNAVRFSLPFIESYLLAAELRESPDVALRYFQLDDSFDITTFDLYAELGASPAIIDALLKSVEQSIKDLQPVTPSDHILLTDEVRPVLLGKPDRIEALQKMLNKTAEDVKQDRGDREHKQRLLDMADRVRRAAVRRSEQVASVGTNDNQTPMDKLALPIEAWSVATVLLGSGAEHLDGATKQKLAKMLVQLGTLILDAWTRLHKAVDFKAVKSDAMKSENIEKVSKGDGPFTEPKDAERFISDFIDLIEFVFLAEPFRRIVQTLCEQARHRVLATSVERAEPVGKVENIMFATWLTDIDSKRGSETLKRAMKELPPAPFLRLNLAAHFLTRVYWNHWRKEDRLILLEAAEDAIKPLQMSFNKSKMKRMIEREDKEAQREADKANKEREE